MFIFILYCRVFCVFFFFPAVLRSNRSKMALSSFSLATIALFFLVLSSSTSLPNEGAKNRAPTTGFALNSSDLTALQAIVAKIQAQLTGK